MNTEDLLRAKRWWYLKNKFEEELLGKKREYSTGFTDS